MQSVDEIVEAIHKLPKNEQEKISRILERERLEKQKEVAEQVERFKAAEKWLKENRAEYLGQWVCLYGDKLIAHGTDGLEVHRKAKEAGIESPYLVRVIEEPENFVGAWI
jgi:adenine specific DNA methylase Mod